MSQSVVLDTNIVLDLLVFADPAAQPLRRALAQGRARWVATAAMRVELQRVLGYPQITPRLAFYGLQPQDVLNGFDARALVLEAPVKAGVTCSDPDDQIFIDLAVAHRALLLSKDRAVLSMNKRLAALGVRAQPAINNDFITSP